MLRLRKFKQIVKVGPAQRPSREKAPQGVTLPQRLRARPVEDVR
jgi:hypothetical protein